MEKLVIQFVIFALIGLGMEVFFTAALNAKKQFKNGEKTLKGYSSIWYIPLYGLVAPIYYFCHKLFEIYPWFIRGLIYMLIIYTAEFIWMGLLRLVFGHSPSEKEYYASGRSIMGLIRWDFAPAWFFAGLFLEFLAKNIF